ncbi:MAG TPA: hypothetical protein VJX66_21805 [Amycolatopsis sp.]|nr:hypothetical protein [Amycolatopsis sp.]
MNTVNRPYRWDLVRPDQLGTLLEGTEVPELWFLDALIECAAKVLARSGGGRLHFVGRSADSMYDFLTGALEHTDWRTRVSRLPMSMTGVRFDGPTVALLRANLAAAGLSPEQLARGRGPIAFVDLVYSGNTFTQLYHQLRTWVADERVSWDVVRTKLRFVGITERERTGPNTWRWQQAAGWPAELPANAVRDVSLDREHWSYLGDHQRKLSPSFKRKHWSGEPERLRRDKKTRHALAQALALVAAGRDRRNRELLARHLRNEPMSGERAVRTLLTQLTVEPGARSPRACRGPARPPRPGRTR